MLVRDPVKAEENVAGPRKRRKRASEEETHRKQAKKLKRKASEGEPVALLGLELNGVQRNEEINGHDGPEDAGNQSSRAEQPSGREQILLKSTKTRREGKGVENVGINTDRAMQLGPISEKEVLRVNGSITSKAPVHKRFGDEDDALNQLFSDEKLETYQAPRPDQKAVEDESEDDAPETVTVSKGLEQVRAANAEAARARDIQNLAAREKRQKREARLKQQAESSKKLHRTSIANATQDPEPEPEHIPSLLDDDDDDDDDIPDYLPDELLAEEAPHRFHTPPPLISITNQPKKRKFTEPKVKPPKDVKHGSVIIRVLENNKSTLPPKPSQTSKSLRESWLMGIRRKNGAVASKRRKVGGGFLLRNRL